MLSLNCVIFGSTKCKFIKEQEAKGLINISKRVNNYDWQNSINWSIIYVIIVKIVFIWVFTMDIIKKIKTISCNIK